MDRKDDFERRVPEVEFSRRIWKIIVGLRNKRRRSNSSAKTLQKLSIEYEPRSKKKTGSKKLILVETAFALANSLSLPPSTHGVHAFSGELALADSVAGASGGTGAHVTVDTLGTPWTFFPYQTQRDPISKSSFSVIPPRAKASTG